MDGLPDRASVVVIGGGAIGVSIAFHLAEAGVEDIVLVERGTLGSGSTSRAAGGLRAQFSDALNVRLAQRSLDAYARFAERPGGEIDLRVDGYLYLLHREQDVAAFEETIALGQSLGVPARLISPAEATELCPVLHTEGLIAAVHAPTGARAAPEGVVQGYASAARAAGAALVTRCEVVAIDVAGSTDGHAADREIRGVLTDRGAIATDTVVCAAGAWSRACGAMAGVELSVTPVRTGVVVTEPVSGIPPDMPLTSDLGNRYYLHPEGPGVLLGYTEPSEPAGFDLNATDSWQRGLHDAVTRRTPALADCGTRGGWSGLLENTPDHTALIGEAPGPARFLYATGFSGHGFMQAPAVGEVVRDLVLGTEPFVDVTPLAADRFAAGGTRPEHAIV